MGTITTVLIEGGISLIEQLSTSGIEYIILDEVNGCELLRFAVTNSNEHTSGILIDIFDITNKALHNSQMDEIRSDFFNGRQLEFDIPDHSYCLDIYAISGELKVLENIVQIYNSALLRGIG